jgi:L-alanine-DL-glutamate epimerase-like enolase superfamily enzyme
MAAPHGVRIAPHNWGSFMGYIQEMHVAPSISNWYRGEHDPLTNTYLIADGYKITDGFASYPAAPGFGLRIDQERFAREAKIRFELK